MANLKLAQTGRSGHQFAKKIYSKEAPEPGELNLRTGLLGHSTFDPTLRKNCQFGDPSPRTVRWHLH
ncbi:hypothetical protein L596_026657 [Steinernema carpocapsae]|uniref:Uncharacterized protein n=1 Tax=Steinernema carpocapsae TaxID=34508 RepID=A0A4U5M229_STECR|nr:hypothetical protein L596_026657 [Steinernema carpocapsae]